MSIAGEAASAVRRIAIVIAIALAFLFGLATTVYLSLRSPEVRVPDVLGKDRFVAENELQAAGLNFRVRATRPSNQVKADTVLFQLPRAGEVVKAGQTVAVDVSRAAKEGEASEGVASDKPAGEANANRNTNESPPAGNANSNTANRNKNTNKNGNTNANANANANARGNTNRTGNTNSNSNRVSANTNVGASNANATRNANSGVNNNQGGAGSNTNSNRPNQNANRPPPVTIPTPPNF